MDEATFSQQIAILLLDKFVITVLILLAGFIFNRILEKFKAGQQKEVEKLKSEQQKELEKLKRMLSDLQEAENLRERYSNPLLKAAEELYNKINDIYKNQGWAVEKAFVNLTDKVDKFKKVSDITSSSGDIYLASVLYLFARFFGAIEIIKKDVGFLELASDEETSEFYLCLRQTIAVFFSGRLVGKEDYKISIRENGLGRIVEGTQILIGELMLCKTNGPTEIISFYEFCEKLTSNENFRICLSPVTKLLDSIEIAKVEDEKISEPIDFRWTRLLFFASYLRGLIEKIDSAKVVNLLPELKEEHANPYFKDSKVLRKNIEYFEKGYPSPYSLLREL